jgi:hypothetical protein
MVRVRGLMLFASDLLLGLRRETWSMQAWIEVRQRVHRPA